VLDHVDLGGGLGVRYRDEETDRPVRLRARDSPASWERAGKSSCSSRDGSWSPRQACC
jgi:diaminopimelate decarboxylase